MRLIDNPAIKLFCALVFSLVIIVTSCKTPVYTSFAPFDARLEPVPDSVAKYLIFLNTDGRTLHNYNFSAYLWNDVAGKRRSSVIWGLVPGYCPASQFVSILWALGSKTPYRNM